MSKDESKEDKEMKKTLKEFTRYAQDVKRKAWEPYRKIFPELYKEEFGSKSEIRSEVENVIDKMKDKLDGIEEENKELKAYVRKLNSAVKQRNGIIEKQNKIIERLSNKGKKARKKVE